MLFESQTFIIGYGFKQNTNIKNKQTSDPLLCSTLILSTHELKANFAYCLERKQQYEIYFLLVTFNLLASGPGSSTLVSYCPALCSITTVTCWQI